MKRKSSEVFDGENEVKKTLVSSQAAGQSEMLSLFQANLNKLQISELLKEVTFTESKQNEVDKFISVLTRLLKKIGSKGQHLEHKLADLNWTQQKKVLLPLTSSQLLSVKGTFKFCPVKSVSVVGGYRQGTCSRRSGTIDLAVEIPKDCIKEKDYLNERYLFKRATYLAYIASALNKSEHVCSVEYTVHHDICMKPLLLVKAAESYNLKHVTFALHICLEQGTFKLSRFHIDKNNIRSKWFSGDEEGSAEEDYLVATPHYNTWVLSDLTMLANNLLLEKSLDGHQNLKDGIALLKVWLHQRQLDQGFGCCSGFVMSMLVAYLLANNKLNASLSAYQVFRKTVQEIDRTDWRTEGIAMPRDAAAGQTANCPSLAQFHFYFDVVFVDASGYVNLCADMCAATYQMLKHEARIAVQLTELMNSFQPLFMKPVSFVHKYDQLFCVDSSDVLRTEAVKRLKLERAVIDYCGDAVSAALPHITKLLYKALGQRVQLVGVKPAANKTWSVAQPAPSVESPTELWFGLLFDQHNCTVAVDHGPAGNAPEAAEFREFWGEKSELRRFAESGIHETVVWSSDTVADRRMVSFRIVRHILMRHCGFLKDQIRSVSNQLDSLLRPNIQFEVPASSCKPDTVLPSYGTGEEQQADIITVFGTLAKLIRSTSQSSPEITLSVVSVQGIDPAFRYTSVFPALAARCKTDCEKRGSRLVPKMADAAHSPMYTPAMTVICELEGSGRWPDDVEAIRRLKTAYYLALSSALKSASSPEMHTAVYPDYLDIQYNGYIFRVTVGCKYEITLLKTQRLPDGKLKVGETEQSIAVEHQLFTMPRFTSLLHAVHMDNSSFGGSVRLAKRWLASQMVLHCHIEEEAVELLVASLFVNPAPFTAPCTPLQGFLRFLRLLSTHDWARDPVIVNLNNEFSGADVSEIESRFAKERGTLPLMFISSPVDKWSQHFTKSTHIVVLQRIALLARESLSILENLIFKGASKSEFKKVFRPSKDMFDVVINLRREHVRMHCSVDPPTMPLHCISYSVLPVRTKDLWPVYNYDPVQLFISELQACIGDGAVILYDCYGGRFIGILFKPSVAQPVKFAVSHLALRKPLPDGQLQLDLATLIEDINVIGKGLVADIELSEKFRSAFV